MGYNINLPAGTYRAHAIEAGAYETVGGALMVGVKWELANDARDSITSRTCIVTKAGVVQEKHIANIHEWAPGWDGVSMDWFAQHVTEFDVELVIERRVDSYDGKEKPEVKYINPVGGGSHGAIPQADQRALSAKYGARLRAIAGAQPKPVTAAAQTQTKATPAAAPVPPAANPPADELAAKKKAAWDAFKAAFKGADGERNAAWFALLARAVPGKADYNAFTPADWDAVIATASRDDDMPF